MPLTKPERFLYRSCSTRAMVCLGFSGLARWIRTCLGPNNWSRLKVADNRTFSSSKVRLYRLNIHEPWVSRKRFQSRCRMNRVRVTLPPSWREVTKEYKAFQGAASSEVLTSDYRKWMPHALGWPTPPGIAWARSAYWSRQLDRYTSVALGWGPNVLEVPRDIRLYVLRRLSAWVADSWCYLNTYMTVE